MKTTYMMKAGYPTLKVNKWIDLTITETIKQGFYKNIITNIPNGDN